MNEPHVAMRPRTCVDFRAVTFIDPTKKPISISIREGDRISTEEFLVVVFYPQDRHFVAYRSMDESEEYVILVIMVKHTKHTHTFQNYGKEVGERMRLRLFFTVPGYTKLQVEIYSQNQVTG